MSRKLILVGGGGHCKSVIDVAESAGYTILGILDQPENVCKKVLGYEIIGTDNDMAKFVEQAEFVVTVGQIKSSALRRKLVQMVIDAGGKLAIIVASDAYVSKYAKIGEGTVVMHKAVVNAGASVGNNCIINTMANVEHDCQIGDFCHVSTGVMVNGEVFIGKDSFIGSNSVIHQCAAIEANTIIPAGSIVKKTQ